MDLRKQYWVDQEPSGNFACPNVSLFRFLGTNGLAFKNLNVLEIGFGGNSGADLMEFQKRGAKARGVDLNGKFVDWFKENFPRIDVRVMDAGKDVIPFESLDLIYSRDTLYYLSDEEISFNFQQSYQALTTHGWLAFQVVEKDVKIAVNFDKTLSFDFEPFLSGQIVPIFSPENPIRFLDIDYLIGTAKRLGFELIASKAVIESYDRLESHFRLNRYFLLRKS